MSFFETYLSHKKTSSQISRALKEVLISPLYFCLPPSLLESPELPFLFWFCFKASFLKVLEFFFSFFIFCYPFILDGVFWFLLLLYFLRMQEILKCCWLSWRIRRNWKEGKEVERKLSWIRKGANIPKVENIQVKGGVPMMATGKQRTETFLGKEESGG